MGRLSTYAKNQIIKLRFQKHSKITQIVKTLTKEDNIKISRQSVSTFLKKYLETESIHDKPRSGRKRKLTTDEIQLIGEITRTNREITARAIKEYLNLNVSTYTILRATKLFEWNKLNPNSNAAKKAAAMERQMRGEGRRRKNYIKKAAASSKTSISNLITNNEEGVEEENEDEDDEELDDDEHETTALNHSTTSSIELPSCIQLINLSTNESTQSNHPSLDTSANNDLYDLKLINDYYLILFKNNACSPMSFATKILFKIFDINELHGHNVSGKTFHKHIIHKKPLEERRLFYIRWLVEKHFLNNSTNAATDSSSSLEPTMNRDLLWKSCCNAINKMIRRSEVNAMNKSSKLAAKEGGCGESDLLKVSKIDTEEKEMYFNENNNELKLNENEIGESSSILQPSTSTPSRIVLTALTNTNDENMMQYDDIQQQQSLDNDEFIEIETRQPISQLRQQQAIELQQTQAGATSSNDSATTELTTMLPVKKQFVVVAAVHQPQKVQFKKIIRIDSQNKTNVQW